MKGQDNEQKQELELIVELKKLVEYNPEYFASKIVPKIYLNILKKNKDPMIILETLQAITEELPRGTVRHAFKEIKMTDKEAEMNKYINKILREVKSNGIEEVLNLFRSDGENNPPILRDGEIERRLSAQKNTQQKKW